MCRDSEKGRGRRDPQTTEASTKRPPREPYTHGRSVRHVDHRTEDLTATVGAPLPPPTAHRQPTWGRSVSVSDLPSWARPVPDPPRPRRGHHATRPPPLRGAWRDSRRHCKHRSYFRFRWYRFCDGRVIVRCIRSLSPGSRSLPDPNGGRTRSVTPWDTRFGDCRTRDDLYGPNFK